MAGKPVIFYSDDSAAGLQDAKAYISRFGLTREDVQLVQRDGSTLIFAKRDVRALLSD